MGAAMLTYLLKPTSQLKAEFIVQTGTIDRSEMSPKRQVRRTVLTNANVNRRDFKVKIHLGPHLDNNHHVNVVLSRTVQVEFSEAAGKAP